MYQLLIDLHPEGTAIAHSDNAKVIPFDPATPDAARESALRAVDELLTLVKSGQYVAPVSEAAAASAAASATEPTPVVTPAPTVPTAYETAKAKADESARVASLPGATDAEKQQAADDAEDLSELSPA